MDLDIVLLSQRKTNTLWYYLYVKSEKKKKGGTNELIYKTEIKSQM